MADTIRQDPSNANRGTERGEYMVEHSLRTYGAGRSVLVDKHGTLIAGNKTAMKAMELDIPIRIIETDGRELIAVKRTDLDLDTDPAAKELGVIDNRASEVGLSWDPGVLAALQDEGADFSAMWFDYELAQTLGQTPEGDDPNAHWAGMPEFEQEDQRPVKRLTVSFLSTDAVEQFAHLLGQKITMATDGIYFPAIARSSRQGIAYVSGQDEV